MNSIHHILTALTMLVSLQTDLGVLLHDTNLDKAFVSSWKMVKYSAHADTGDVKMPETTLHTHPEHARLSEVLRDRAARPRTTPRNDDRKHLRQKRVARGHHTFDGYRLVLDELA